MTLQFHKWICQMKELAENKKNEGGVGKFVVLSFISEVVWHGFGGDGDGFERLEGGSKLDRIRGDADYACQVFQDRLLANHCIRTTANTTVS